MAREPIAGMVEKNIPSQIDMDDVAAEVELAMPPGATENIVDFQGTAQNMDIEILPDDDGGVTIDFDPKDQRGEGDDFYMNLAEEIPDRELGRIAGELLSEFDANKSGRQEWEDAYANGLELLGFSYEERAQPFRGATGVTHPLLAEAATQFQAQAFNELLPASGPVRTAVLGAET